MANLISTVVNGTLNSTGRITASYDTDRYQMNFNRASASSWWVTNDSSTLGLHLNNVGDRFYFSTNGDFWSSTNGWLSTALAGKSNVGHTHDDRYYTESESDARFQPLENQRLSTGNNVTFNQVYTNNWFRNNASNTGLYNEATTMHLSSQLNGYWDMSSTTTWSGIRFYTGGHVSALRGYVYANTSNEIGFLTNDGNWGLQVDSSKNVRVYGVSLTIGNTTSSDIYMIDTDETTRRIHCNSSRIGFLSSSNTWGSWAANDGSWNSDQSMRAPIFYDSQDTTYYLDPNSTTALRTVGSWRADSAAWDGEFAGKIQYHSNNWYFQASSNWFFRNSGASNVVSIDSGGNISANGFVGNNSAQTRDKLRVWDSSSYTIGMKSGYDYGHLGNDEYAMSFQMNDNSGRGFWWGDDAHNDNQGAASLTTDGRMTIARSLSVGEGEAVVSPSSTPLYVKGSTSGADVVGVDGINGRLFTVTDDLSNSLFSVNTIAGLPVIEAFADNTVNIGKYGSATTWSTTGFVTMPNSANIYRDLFINGGRGGNFGNRLIIGTDAATYTMQDGNQRPTAYLHGAYPVLTLNHTVSNGSHGPTIQFAHNTENKQWVIGSNGTGTRLDIGYSENTNRNPHNGIDDYLGSTFFRINNGGHIELGRGNGRSTWVNDTLYVGASDSGDSHMYFGEDSSGWYGLHWYWDSAYTVYLYGRNAGTDTEIMRYTTNSNAYVEWRRHFHMNNYDINYLSQIHFNDDVRFYDDGNNQYLNFKWGNGGAGGIQFWDGDGSRQGYVYGSGTGSFGLLDSGGNWKVRVDTSNVEMYGAQYLTDVYAYILYDRSDSSYYLDPASYSRIWRTSTHWAPSPGVGSSNWVNDFNATPVSSMSFGGDLSAGGPQGSWWFQQNMRHSNTSNYWGTQIAWGWEDNANELWQRNVTGGSWSSWVRYINTNNYAGILDARYYTETEVNSLLSAKQDASTAITTSNIGSQSVNYATSAGSATNVTVNSGNTSAAWYPIVWHSGNTLYSSSGTTEIYPSGGYIRSSYINTTDNDETGITRFVIKNGDNYHRSATTTSAANIIRDVASGSWGISITGNAATATSATSATSASTAGYADEAKWIAFPDGPRDLSDRLPNWNNRSVAWDFVGAGTANGSGNYGGVMTFSPWDGTSASTGDSSYQLAFANATGVNASGQPKLSIRNGINSTWNAWYTLIHSGNIGDQSVNYATTAGTANAVAWTNVSGRPTAVSSFTNDAGYLTASGTIANAQFATQVVTIQDDAPVGANGKLWWESDTGKLKVYYGSSSAWVDATPVPDMSLYYAKAGGPISGDVTIQQTLTVVGNTLIQGTLTETSDISLKENILPLESSLDKVMKLNGVSFNKKATPNVKEIGFIAQEVEAVIPDLVTETNEGIKTVSYSRVTAVLVETIKEQQAQINELKDLVSKLAEKLNSL